MRTFSRRTLIVLIGAVTALAIATASYAAITFDSSNGTGSVGKGDIQQILGLKNNAAAQSWFETNGSSVEFNFTHHAKYEYDCVGVDKKSEPASKEGQTVVNVKASPVFIGRGQSNWAGYSLTGYNGGGGNSHTVPQEGDFCNDGKVEEGEIANVVQAAHPTPRLELVMEWGSSPKMKTVIPF